MAVKELKHPYHRAAIRSLLLAVLAVPLAVPLAAPLLAQTTVSTQTINSAQMAISSHMDETGCYVSIAQLVIDEPFEATRDALMDFENYGHWAPRRQNGADPISASYIGQLKDFVYNRETAVMGMVFDINLMRPFGSRGNVARFSAATLAVENRAVINLTLMNPSIAFNQVSVNFIVESQDGGQKSFLETTVKVRYAWFLRKLFPLEKYRKIMENRVRITAGNLDAYLSGETPDNSWIESERLGG